MSCFSDASENAMTKVPWESVSGGLEISEAPKCSVSDDVSSRLSLEIACAVNDRLHLAMRRWATH